VTEVKPLLKWAGGKRRLLQTLFEVFPANFELKQNKYFEPFVGGGAVLFGLANRLSAEEVGSLSRKQKSIIVSDTNGELINFYKVVRDSPDKLSNRIRELAKRTDREDFYNVRSSSPKTEVGRAARLLYLNRLCFNGLFRVNSKGEFNVPYGRYINPNIYNPELIKACSAWLENAQISEATFKDAVTRAKKGDLVYFDPPYIPLSATASFASYSKEGFCEKDQRELAKVIAALTKKGVYVVLSNSDTKLSRQIFDDLNLFSVPVGRSISANGAARSKVKELIGTNYPTELMKNPSRIKKLRVR
jgi:DNA adenine methylase